jgi:hypothetical protein
VDGSLRDTDVFRGLGVSRNRGRDAQSPLASSPCLILVVDVFNVFPGSVIAEVEVLESKLSSFYKKSSPSSH